MKGKTIALILVLIIIIIGGFWFIHHHKSSATTENPITQNIPSGQMGPLLVEASSTALGNYLTANDGMTLYTYAHDATSTSNCSDACATTWPPYTIPAGSNLVVGPGVSGSLATITRADGSVQMTYNGMPLYFYSQDAVPGDTKGERVGDVWFVAQP